MVSLSSDGRFSRVGGTSIKTPYGEIYNGFDRDTGNEVMWRVIDGSKVDQSMILGESELHGCGEQKIKLNSIANKMDPGLTANGKTGLQALDQILSVRKKIRATNYTYQ